MMLYKALNYFHFYDKFDLLKFTAPVSTFLIKKSKSRIKRPAKILSI